VKIEEIKKEIIDHVKKNIIASFSFIFLLFGGLIFYIYYLDIKYLPNLDLISSVQLLAVASLTGFLLVLSTISMLIFPGLFWQKYIFTNETLTNVWSNKLSRIIVIFICPTISVYYYLYSLVANQSGFKIIKYHKYMVLAYYASIISILPTMLLILVFLSSYKDDIKNFDIGCLFLIVCIVISNSIAIGKPEDVNSTYWFFTVGLISFLSITVLTNTASTFPKAIMKTYKLGNIETSSIIVDKQSCNTINNPNVLILSKLGTEAYIEFDEINIKIKDKEYKTMRFTIPSSSIITYNLVW